MKYSVKKNNDNGTISLEAAIMMPMFMFIILFLYGLILMFSGQQLINHASIQSTQSLSIDSYAGDSVKYDKNNESISLVYNLYQALVSYDGSMNLLDNLNLYNKDNSNFQTNIKWYNPGTNTDKPLPVIKRRFIGYLTNNKDITEGEKEADDILKKYGIKGGIDSLDFSGSEINGKDLIINVKFKQDFIFNFNGFASFDREITLRARMW